MNKTGEYPNIDQMACEFEKLTTGELRRRYAEYYEYTTQSRNRGHLISKILWAVQRDIHGDISEAAKARALKIADDRDIRERFPRRPPSSKKQLSLSTKSSYVPGTVFTRVYKGEEYHVTVLENGFEYDGRWFKSLSAIAREITGTQWNGKLFFKLKEVTR